MEEGDIQLTVLDSEHIINSSMEIQATPTWVPGGRSRKEGYRRDARAQRATRDRTEQVNQQQQCSTCQRTGHHACTYLPQPSYVMLVIVVVN